MKLQTKLLIGILHSTDVEKSEKAEAIRELITLASSGDEDANDALRTRCGLCYACRHGSYDPCPTAPLASCKDEDLCTCEECGNRVPESSLTCVTSGWYTCKECATRIAAVNEIRTILQSVLLIKIS